MKKTSKRIVRLVTVLLAAIFVFGCTTTVFGATDLVGRGTAGGINTANRPAVTNTNTPQQTGAVTTPTVTQQTTPSTPTGQYAVQGNEAPSSKNPQLTNQATTSQVKTTVQTGVMEKIYPFLIVIGAAFVAFWMFFHLQMNQVRYGKSEKYYKELLDFICACRP